MPDSRVRLRRSPGERFQASGDICVVGSGIAGVSAALEAARLGRRVVLLDAQGALGGQAVNGIIGTFCGLYSNGPQPYQVTYGVASDIIAALQSADAMRPRRGRNTLILQYDEVALARWVDAAVRDAGIVPLLGAVLCNVRMEGRRVVALEAATRFGEVQVEAGGFVDASGDAMLAWLAGLEVQECRGIYGTTMFTIEGLDERALERVTRAEITERARAKAAAYGLVRHDGFVFAFSGRGSALVNMSHIPTPLEPVAMTRASLDGRDQADRVMRFLRSEFPVAFGSARVRSYGAPGVRQTRTIRAAATLSVEAVRRGERFPDAVARCSWPIELHDQVAEAHWEVFGDEHMHYVPLACMLPAEADNVVAAGRCIDADPVALSSVRVMGPCIAMGMAAAHVLDLAGARPVHALDVDKLKERLRENLERREPSMEEA